MKNKSNAGAYDRILKIKKRALIVPKPFFLYFKRRNLTQK